MRSPEWSQSVCRCRKDIYLKCRMYLCVCVGGRGVRGKGMGREGGRTALWCQRVQVRGVSFQEESKDRKDVPQDTGVGWGY